MGMPKDLDQDRYRWYDDDGSESANTAAANEDTSIDFDVTSGNVQSCIRIRLYETANEAFSQASAAQLQVNVNGGTYQDVTTSSTIVKAFDSTNLVEEEGGDTTQRLTVGGAYTFISTNGGIIEDGLCDFTPEYGGNDGVELLYTVEMISADLSDNDSLNFQVIGDVDSYTLVANATITKTGGGGGGGSHKLTLLGVG